MLELIYLLTAETYDVTAVMAIPPDYGLTDIPYNVDAGLLELATQAAPELATWALLMAGVGVMGAAPRTRRRVAAE